MTEFLFGVFNRILKRYGETVIREVGERYTFQTNFETNHYIQQTSADLIRNVNDYTKSRIRAQFAESFNAGETVEQFKERVIAVFQEADTVRAQRIATTESTRVTGYASDEALSQAGVDYKQWLTTLDGHERSAHHNLNGQVVPVEGKFEINGQSADHPGGFPTAGMNINCRCGMCAAFPQDSKKSKAAAIVVSTDAEREALLRKREPVRQICENEVLESFRKIFTMQREAVLSKINTVSGES